MKRPLAVLENWVGSVGLPEAQTRESPGGFRGAGVNPPNRFEPVVFDTSESQLLDDEQLEQQRGPPTRYFVEHARTALTYNQSPDIPFEVSVNPYRGCEHGCSYCYARPFHEYLGLSAGVEFETMIFAKVGLADLLRKDLAARSYRPATITMSGITDCYQPVERRLRITRSCLEVLVDCRHPVDIITKNHLVTRDLDLLAELARHQAARVDISITTLDNEVSRKMEPRASTPRRRLEAVEACAKAGVPVGVLVSPIVPGLTDHEMAGILRAAVDAGARWAHMIPLRLPGAVEQVFVDWLAREYPSRYEKVLGRQKELRNGKLNDARFGHRFRGHGVFYDHLKQVFVMERRRLGIEGHGPKLTIEHFRKPGSDTEQMYLFR